MRVYFIQCGDSGPVKVGKSRDVDSRLAELQVANSEELHVRAILFAESEANAYYLEKKLHNKFKKYHIRGEWFKHNILKMLRGIALPEIL